MSGGPRIGDMLLKPLQCSEDQGAQPALVNSFGQRVNWRDAIQMKEPFFARFDDFSFGVVDRSWLQVDWFPERHDFIADRKIFLHERQIPPSAVESRGAVIEN